MAKKKKKKRNSKVQTISASDVSVLSEIMPLASQKTLTFPDGGGLNVEFTGQGNGTITLTPEKNEGLDRETTITVKDVSGKVSINMIISQNGMRQVFNASDGAFKLKSGGSFLVLKKE